MALRSLPGLPRGSPDGPGRRTGNRPAPCPMTPTMQSLWPSMGDAAGLGNLGGRSDALHPTKRCRAYRASVVPLASGLTSTGRTAMRRDDLTIRVDGAELAAWRYLPDGTGPHPLVVMSHGFGAVREMALPRFAEIFA